MAFKDKYSIDLETDDAPPNPPERLLLLAMLDRAVRDLDLRASVLERRNAIGWFQANENMLKFDHKFTWKEVKQALDLSSAQLAVINEKVKKAQEYQLSLFNTQPHKKPMLYFEDVIEPLYV